MTLRAEEMTIVNQGVKGKNYGFYRDEVISLSHKLGADSKLEENSVKKHLFILESLSYFINKIQDVESLYKDKPFETRIGIGELFLKPTLEVRVRETGRLVAVFDSIDGYKKVRMGREEMNRILDKKSRNQEKGKELQDKLNRAKKLKLNPSLIFQSEYTEFLDSDVEDKGIVKSLYLYVLRRKQHEVLVSEEGQQMLESKIVQLTEELDEVLMELDKYYDEVAEVNAMKVQHEKYQAGFDHLASLYQIPDTFTLQQQAN
ncbi:hypothetical protein [Rossellomorea marisflavi]|uniref:hypothetical protein n=1 Tax=Rossellomorea marisflavi TaxID=189381 RepID=UPI003F9F8BE5